MPRRIKADASENIEVVCPADLTVNTSVLKVGAANHATTGLIRLPNNTGIKARNSTNTADIALIDVNSSDTVNVSGVGNTTTVWGSTLNIYGSSLNLESDGGMSIAELSDNIAISAGTTLALSGTTSITATSSLINLNTTGTGNVDIGNSTGTIKTYSQQTNYLSTGAAYNGTAHTQSGYTASEERNRYWYGTTSDAVATTLTGSFVPNVATNGTVRIITQVIGTDATATNAYGGTVVATYKNVAGTLSLVSSSEINKQQSGGTGTLAAHVLAVGQIRLNVTGIAATNMRWEAYSTVYFGKGY